MNKTITQNSSVVYRPPNQREITEAYICMLNSYEYDSFVTLTFRAPFK